ncbi:DUF305 domain-containing protein [Nocardia fluminea]|uniref:DUF305 domain-containing protein n=1 Tax=Nocardia fluminea TaxID=134984 RepID=UPI0033D353FA
MSRRVLLGAACAATVLLLLVVGAAIRPLFFSEKATVTPVLTPTEIGFVQDMTGHHQQALVLVERLATDVDPTVRRLADQIADAQRLEIGMMLGWLRLAAATPTNPRPMSWMPTGHHTAAAASSTMPGMATRDDLDALARARGADAEMMFLRLMYRHHQGGVAMARTFDELSDGGPVEQAARDMVSTQSQESGIIGLLMSQRAAPS